jgi:molybdopterin/thiamine biosynthesis adenylyltransferase
MHLKKFNRIVIFGLGGTGSILAPLVARYLFSQKWNGKLILIDGDSYSDSNTDRQIFPSKVLNKNKAEVQAMILVNHIPSMKDQIEYIDEYIGADSVADIVINKTIVINCTDNLAARKIIEDRILTLSTAAHICAGNELNSGQVQISVRENNKQITPSIYDLSPVFNSLNDDRSKMSCDQIASLPSGGQLITANAMSAALCLNYLYQLDKPVAGNNIWIPNDMVMFDNRYSNFSQVNSRNPLDLVKI